MAERENRRFSVATVISAIAVVVLAIGGGAMWWAWNNLTTSTSVPISSPSPSPSQPVQPVEKTVQVYWLNSSGSKIELKPSSLKVKSSKTEDVLSRAFRTLLAGPAKSEFTTTIPEGTKLRHLTVKSDGVHLDLSKEFTTGGGTSSMSGRLAQILFTATSLDPNAKVWLEVEGKPLEVLGGEGLELEQPMTRKYFEENFNL